MNLQTLPGLFISHGSPLLALNPEQVGPALQRLSLNSNKHTCEAYLLIPFWLYEYDS